MSVFDDVMPIKGMFNDQAKVATGEAMGSRYPNGYVVVRIWDATNEEVATGGFSAASARELAQAIFDAADKISKCGTEETS